MWQTILKSDDAELQLAVVCNLDELEQLGAPVRELPVEYQGLVYTFPELFRLFQEDNSQSTTWLGIFRMLDHEQRTFSIWQVSRLTATVTEQSGEDDRLGLTFESLLAEDDQITTKYAQVFRDVFFTVLLPKVQEQYRLCSEYGGVDPLTDLQLLQQRRQRNPEASTVLMLRTEPKPDPEASTEIPWVHYKLLLGIKDPLEAYSVHSDKQYQGFCTREQFMHAQLQTVVVARQEQVVCDLARNGALIHFNIPDPQLLH